MIGGTLGVAVIGAVFQATARSDLSSSLAGSGLTASQRSEIATGLGGGVSTVPSGVSHQQATEIASASRDAFISAFASSMKVATAVALAGVIVAVTLIRSRREGVGEAKTPAGVTPAAELATGEHSVSSAT
jgi:hypothetical protein